MRLPKRSVDELLVACFVIVVLTGAFLAFFHTPSDQASHDGAQVIYDGSYEPLRGVMMDEAYASALQLSFDVTGGVLMRLLHQWSSVLLLAGIVVRTALSGAFLRWLPGIALLGLGALNTVIGFTLADERFAEKTTGGVPALWRYGAHLLLALAVAAAAVLGWRRAGGRRPRALYVVVICLGLVPLLLLGLS
ncbi:hypothetical protein AB0J63_14055 [Streptosporangium canum]|uniref:hypothetical protein n=1 Tax=Streptosporangium canum TaxID=324952 RepID=UPI003420A5AE